MVGFRWRHAEELRPNRNPHHLGVAKVPLGLFKVDSGSRDPSANHLVGKSRDIVGLKGQGRNAAHDGSRHSWTGRISTHSNHDVWTKLPDDLAGMQNGQ